MNNIVLVELEMYLISGSPAAASVHNFHCTICIKQIRGKKIELIKNN